MNHIDIYNEIKRKGSFLCVGLDTDPELIPQHLRRMDNCMFEFNRAIIDATAEYAVAYKPNVAFYEAEGVEGWRQLEMTVGYIRSRYPEILIIADAKRGDIGNTAKKYAKTFFSSMDCDAVTLSPYMGEDSVKPFLAYEGRWSVILAMTSNPSAVDFEPEMYEKVLKKASGWGTIDNTMFVVGATRAELLSNVRAVCPDHFLLVPGVGAQGGSLEDVAAYGMNSRCGLLVNSSRGIIYAGKDEKFASAAASAASELASQMKKLLEKFTFLGTV